MPTRTDIPDVTFARPTITIDEQQFNQVNELALAVEMMEQEGGLSTLELRLSNVASNARGSADLAFDDNTLLKLGAAIAFYAGKVSGPTEVFRGVVTGLEAEFSADQPPELVVLAEDKLQQGRMQRRTKTYTDYTAAKLAGEVAQRLSLKLVGGNFTDTLGVQVQLNESDLAFLRRVLARYDADVQVVGHELHVSPRSKVSRGQVQLQLFEELRRARITADLADQVSAVTVAGFDAEKGVPFSVQGIASALGSGQGMTGSAALGKAGLAHTHHVAHLTAINQPEAKALAEAIHAQRARRFVRVEATADGNPAIRVGTLVSLRGLGRRFSNDCYVTRCVHRWDVERGYETDFEAECAYLGGN